MTNYAVGMEALSGDIFHLGIHVIFLSCPSLHRAYSNFWGGVSRDGYSYRYVKRKCTDTAGCLY